MAKISIDLSEFKKVSGDDSHSMLRHNSDSHEIKLVHESLPSKMVKELMQLPCYDDGGEVQPSQWGLDAPLGNPAYDVDADIASQADKSMATPVSMPLESLTMASEPIPSKVGYSTPPVNADATSAPSSEDSYGVNQEAESMKQGLRKQQAGVQETANAESAAAQGQANVINSVANKEQLAIKKFQSEYNTLDDEQKQFMKDLSNAHIDPQRYQKEHGSVLTTIGLILGGIGGGMTGQGNPAMDFLNKQIDRDIEAQKSEIGNKKSILEANLHRFGNLKDATDMTRVMQASMYQHQIGAAAAKSTDPIIQARALKAQGELQTNIIAPVMQQMAMKKVMYGDQQLGQATSDVLDPNLKQSFRINGQKYYAHDEKSAGEAQDQSQAIEDYQKALKDVNDFNAGKFMDPTTGKPMEGGSTLLGGSLSLTKRQGLATALNERSKAALTSLLEKGKSFSPRLLKALDDQAPQAGSLKLSNEGSAIAASRMLDAMKKSLIDTHSLRGNPGMLPLSGKK